MTDDCAVHPDALLESVVSVDRLILPALTRLGIITVGQMAALDVRRLSREWSIGVRKRKLLVSLSAAAVEALRHCSRQSSPTASEPRPGRRSGRHQKNLPLVFVPSMLKNALNRHGIRTVRDLLAVDPDSLTELPGWGTARVELVRSLSQLYQKMISEVPSRWFEQGLQALVPACFLPDSGIGKCLIRDVIGVDFDWSAPPSTAMNDFASLRNLLRYWMDLDSQNSPDPSGENRSAATRGVADIPLFFVPTILESRFLDLNATRFDDLKSVDVLNLESLGGWGCRRTDALIAVRDLYEALFSGRTFVADSSRLSDLPGAETLFDSDVCSMTVGEILESSSEWIGLCGSTAADYAGLRNLLQLARLRSRDRGEQPAEVMSCLSPEIDRTLRWKEIPLNIPVRGRTFLDRCKVETLSAVDTLAVTGQIRSSETGEFRSVKDDRGFTRHTLHAIRTQLLRLSLLGLEQYRYGDSGKPVTCSDVVARVRELTKESHFEILRDRSSGITLHELAAGLNLTRERVRQIELYALELGRRCRDAAVEILDPWHSHLRCHGKISFTAALNLVGAKSPWELCLIARIAGNPIHWISARRLCLLMSSAEGSVPPAQLSQWIFLTDDGDLVTVRTRPSAQ